MANWRSLQGMINPAQWNHVLERLESQQDHVRYWAEHMTAFIQKISKQATPESRQSCF